jgi:hypothetical protein
MAQPPDGDTDWRLQAKLGRGDGHRGPQGLIGRLRDPDYHREAEAAVPPDVVVTHDGSDLFAYAYSEASLRAARKAIEGVLAKEGIDAQIRLSHWDENYERWRQVDPPLSPAEQEGERAADRAADVIETRTLVATSGKLVRAEFERTMLDWAHKLGLECKILEKHPHLLSTQVGFTVTGRKGQIDEFASALEAEGWTFVRTETGVMLSPL